MSREALIVWLGFVFVTAFVAVFLQGYLLYRAIGPRRAVSGARFNSPERIVADDILLSSSLLIILALAATGIGTLFIYLTLQAPPPPNLDRTYDLSQGVIILLLLLTTISLVVVMLGISGVVNLHRLTASLGGLRQPPEACKATTFEGCPYISPERQQQLVEIRAKAEAIEGTAHEITIGIEQLEP